MHMSQTAKCDSEPHLAPAASCVAPHLACLRYCGFQRSPRRRAHAAHCALALALTSLYLLQECVYAYQVRDDMAELARVMFLLLCHVTSLAKQIVFCVDAARVERLVVGLADPALEPRSEHAALRLHETARRARWLQRGYSGCAVFTCTLWLVFPVADFARGRCVRLPYWLPVRYDDNAWRFTAALLYSYGVTTLVGVANTTMDAFMGTVLYQCKTQLSILRVEVEGLCARAARGGADPLRLLLASLEHHRKIFETTQLLQQIFGGAILVQFGIGGWILCMAAYKLVSLEVLSVEFAALVLFLVCILTELFLYCYFGNEVTVESARLLDALYCCGWEVDASGAVRPFRRALLLAMERARRPLRAAAGRVVPLSLDTFVKILKSSYTFYAVLRQTK